MARSYGKELIIDLYDCDVTKFNRESLKQFFIELCSLIEMERCDLHFWDFEDCPEEYDAAPDHLAGTSAIQFISTSNIVVHTVDRLAECYINVFSCKEFDAEATATWIAAWFDTLAFDKNVVIRGHNSTVNL